MYCFVQGCIAWQSVAILIVHKRHQQAYFVHLKQNLSGIACAIIQNHFLIMHADCLNESGTGHISLIPVDKV